MSRKSKAPDYQTIHDGAMQLPLASRFNLMHELKKSIEAEAKQIAEDGKKAQEVLDNLKAVHP